MFHMSTHSLPESSIIAELRAKNGMPRTSAGSDVQPEAHGHNGRNILVAITSAAVLLVASVRTKFDEVLGSVSSIIHPSGGRDFTFQSLLESPAEKEQKDIDELMPFVDDIKEISLAADTLRAKNEEHGKSKEITAEDLEAAVIAFNRISCMQNPRHPAMRTLVAACEGLVTDMEHALAELPAEVQNKYLPVIPSLRKSIETFKLYVTQVSDEQAQWAEDKIAELLNSPSLEF